MFPLLTFVLVPQPVLTTSTYVVFGRHIRGPASLILLISQKPDESTMLPLAASRGYELLPARAPPSRRRAAPGCGPARGARPRPRRRGEPSARQRSSRRRINHSHRLSPPPPPPPRRRWGPRRSRRGPFRRHDPRARGDSLHCHLALSTATSPDLAGKSFDLTKKEPHQFPF